MTQKLTFVNGAKAACGCRHEFSSGGGEYSDVASVHLCAMHAGSPVLDDRWKARMLDGRAPERDEMGFGNHPELPSLDEGMMPRSFFAALGLELTHTSAEDQLDWDVLGAMSEAVNWSRWMPTAPQGDGWKLVSIFDTEDGPAAWWLRALPEAEDGTTTIRNLQAEVKKLEARIARLSRAGAAPAAVAPEGERQWVCPTRTVADLVNNLLTMDQALPVYGAQYIEKDGRRCAIAVPPTVSRERVLDGRWIGQGEDLNAAVVWTRAEQPAAMEGSAARKVFLVATGETSDGAETYTRHDDAPPPLCDAECLYTAPAAPALEAPAAPAGWKLVPTKATSDMLYAMAECDGHKRGDRDHPGLTQWEDYWHMALAAAPQAPAAPSAEGLREQHDRDSAELRRLCQARDEARRERDLARVEIAGLQASTGHLSALVDGQHALLEKAKATMTALHGSASPIDESGGDFDARIPASAFARFVDAHAELLHAMAQSPAAAPAAPAVDAQPLIARNLAEWHEDDGDVAWWAWCGHGWAGEPAWIGRPTDDGWPGYHTHWTAHPAMPPAIGGQAKEGGEA